MASIIRKNIAAGTANALNGLKNNRVGQGGAYVSLFASTPTAGGTVTLTAEDGNLLLSDIAQSNIEVSADAVTIPRDNIVLNEFVGPGELFLSVDTQIGNFALFVSDEKLEF
jgi:hypothetical protein